MSNILPFLIKIILWGSTEDDGVKKVPMILRVFLAVMLAVIYIGLSGLLFWVGIADHKAMLVILGAVCLISIPVSIFFEIKTKKTS